MDSIEWWVIMAPLESGDWYTVHKTDKHSEHVAEWERIKKALPRETLRAGHQITTTAIIAHHPEVKS